VALRSTAPAPPATPAAPDPSEPPPPERVVAAGEAHEVLDGAIARGRFTDEDAAKLRDRLRAVTDEDRFELLRSFSVAVNDGRLRVEAGPLLF
jgi:hypothetical protein